MPQVNLCPKCQTQNAPGQRICQKCGTRWCLSCGASVPSASRYCPRCGTYCGSEQQARAVQRTSIAGPTQAPNIPRNPAPQTYQTTAASRTPSTMPPVSSQPTIQHQPPRAPSTSPEQTCPQCGAVINISEGQCLSCGLLLGKNIIQKMQQEAISAAPAVASAMPRPTPLPHSPMPQPDTGQQHHGGFITGHQPSQPAQSTTTHSVPEYPQGYGTHQPYTTPTPSYSQPPAAPYGGMQQGGVPIPRAIPDTRPQTMSHPSPAMPYSGMQQQQGRMPLPNALPITMSPAMAYPTRAMPSTGEATPQIPRELAIHPARRSALLKTLTAILCVIIGSIGIYYFVSQRGTPPVPSQPPENASLAIQNVVVPSVTETGATIEWKTDNPGTSQVNICDPAGICIQSEPKEDLVTAHSITLANLKVGTKYHYTAISKDAAGNEAKSEGDLTTLKQADITPPMISEIKPLSITESSVVITWVTDEAATSQVSYGKTSSYGTDMSDDKLITSHAVTLTQLEPATTYHFTVKSTDASGNEAASQTDQTFTTLQPIPVGPNVGSRAPDFTLQTSDGNSVTLSTLRGKIVMVNFWATWCGPCVAEMPNFQEIYNTWPHDQLEILAIHVQQPGTITPQDYKQNNQLTFPVLLDTTGSTASDYSTPSTRGQIPQTFFIDKDGIIRKFQLGSFQDKETIESILNSLK